MRYLKYFLREQIKIFLLVGIFLAAFAGVFALSDIPVRAAGYGFLLCVCVFVIWLIASYARYCRGIEELRRVCDEILVTEENLPEAATGAEYLYQEMLRQVCAAYREQGEEAFLREQDAAEYHSLWAHQIKTPISAIRLLLQSREEGWPELENQLFSIEQYVQMILNYQRLNSAVKDLVLERKPLDPMIRQTVRKFRRQFISKKIALKYEGTDLMVLSDEKWLCFVLEQILSNALKYTPEGSIEIGTKGKTLCIRDTGIGIHPADLPRIFERGYTGCNGREDKRATGLGLYLCRRVCEMLGHGIAVESEVGRGTTVRLALDDAPVDVSW